jgi:hypothetical protein
MLKLSVFFIWSLIFVCGCSTVKDTVKSVAGVSTRQLESARNEAITKNFNYDYKSCYDKVKSALKENGSYIYAEDSKKRMIALYLSQEDTTPVGVFFSQINAANTQIEVSSPSAYAKEFIWAKILLALEKEGLGK